MSQSPQSSPPRLTVAMIVRDEVEHLPASIESASLLADEIVVVDTGSTDGTASIARSLGARVVEHAWGDDFAAARNAAWRVAQGEWLLWLDAGEQLDPSSAAMLRDFVDDSADRNCIYSILVELPSVDPSVSDEQIALPRLMPNRPELRFVGRVRETVLPTAEAVGMTKQLAPGIIVRNVRDHNPSRRTARAQRNFALAMKEATETGQTPVRLLLAAGEAHTELGEIDRAVTTFREATERATPGSSELLEAWYGWLVALRADPTRVDQQIVVCLKALEIFPLDGQLLLSMGGLMQRCDRLDLATRAFDAAVKHGRLDLSNWHLADLSEVATSCLAASLQLQGNDVEAHRVLEEATSACDSPRLLRQMLDLYIKQGRTQAALDVADRLPVSDAEIGPLHEAVQGACLAAVGDSTAALGHLQIAFLDGCRHPICLRWLTLVYLAGDQIEAARSVLAEWQQAEPNSPHLHTCLAAAESQQPQSVGETDGRMLRIDTAEPTASRVDSTGAAVRQQS